MEGVDADLDRAVVGDGIDLERSWNEFARDFAADIVLDAIEHGLAANGQASFVVIELHVENIWGRSQRL